MGGTLIGVLRVGLPDNRRAVGFLQGLPGEDAPDGCSKVALDFAVINALGERHPPAHTREAVERSDRVQP